MYEVTSSCIFVFVLELVSHEKVKWQQEECLGTDVTAVCDSREMIDVAQPVGKIVFDIIR